jgi:hypothetical protein
VLHGRSRSPPSWRLEHWTVPCIPHQVGSPTRPETLGGQRHIFARFLLSQNLMHFLTEEGPRSRACVLSGEAREGPRAAREAGEKVKQGWSFRGGLALAGLMGALWSVSSCREHERVRKRSEGVRTRWGLGEEAQMNTTRTCSTVPKVSACPGFPGQG